MNSQASPQISRPGGEPELVARARAGDREAFAALYNEHQPAVYRFIVRRVSTRPLAEDLTQEVFVRALRRLDTFTWRGTDILAWLHTIARNIVTDHFKRACTRLEVSVGELFDTAELDRSAEDAALRTLDVLEASEAVRAAMARLNPNQRRCLELRYFDDRSVSETARVLDRDERAVKALTWRAMQNLRRAVAL